MRELEETKCEVRNVINFELPIWDQADGADCQDETATTDGSKESKFTQTSGGYLSNDCKYAWLSYGTRLAVVDVRYGKCISIQNFPSKITSISSFPAEPGQVPLLLVGLDNNAIRIKDSVGHLCIFDCCSSTILTTIQVPAGVEKACIIHGGADWEEFHEKRPDTVLSGNTGLIFAALRNLQHVVIDIHRPLWEDAYLDGKSITAKLEFVNDTPTKSISNKSKKEPTHLAYDLMDKGIEQYVGFDRDDFEATPLYDESLCSVLLSSTKIGCLITGCLGRVIIWQNDGSVGWISPSFDENAYVTHVALLEPSDDPRPFYYLWIACQNDSADSSAVLRMYAMLFNRKHSDKSGESTLYFNLESEPSLKFELELEQGERIHNLLPVERENLRESADSCSRRGEDSLLLISSDERMLLFDLNRWYKEQMPRTMAECRNPNSVMASYRTKYDEIERKSGTISSSYIPRSLREFSTKGPTSPEELFYPNSLTLEWVELAVDSLTFWLARGAQSELLREITIAGPIVLVKPSETYRRCLAVGLVPFDTVPQDYSLDAEKTVQREMLLSLCLEQRWANFLIRCATEWSDGSASYIYPEFLRWGVQRASELKLIADQLCVPLFDQSGTNIGETEVKTLRFCGQQLECLTNVVSKLPNPETDLEKQRRALRRIATYLQVLLWFYDVGLLPETQELENEDDLQIPLSMKIPYPKDKLVELYKKKRRSSADNEEKDSLFIDQLLSQECAPLKAQWEREAGSECPNPGGYYPPPSLQSLLRSFLFDCYREEVDNVNEDEEDDDLPEMKIKHSITIYLLMDLAMLLQETHPSVDRLIKYPSAFKLSPSLIKLTQAFWLLDHDDYDGFFKILTGELILSSDIKDWQHKLAVDSLLRNGQHKLALMYLRVLKPPLSTLEDQGTIIGLSVEQGLVESAFHARPPAHYAQLLTKFFQSCKSNGKLKQILNLSLDTEEEEAFIKFLKENDCDDIKLLYYLQRCRHTEASDVFSMENANFNSRVSTTTNKVHPVAQKMLSAFNATLPEVTKKFARNQSKSSNNLLANRLTNQQLEQGNVRGYPRPFSQFRDPAKGIYEVVMSKTRETFLKSERCISGPQYVPFLGAPCSSLIYCTRFSGSALPETNEANSILYPEKKKGKRTAGMMHDGEEQNDDINDRKRRRLASECDRNFSSGDNNEQWTRRLSMSQVCQTPLVERKTKLMDNKDLKDLVTETPHSILKIRQMIRRNSDSPGFGFGSGSSEREAMLRRNATGDSKPARQIRFSVDRLSANDDSAFSTTESNKDENEMNHSGSSKNTEEESCIDSYYSPDVSAKSIRESSILSDSSVTKFIRGPRPRPSLRRSSLLSRTSSDCQSQKGTLLDTTLEVSNTTTDATQDNVNASTISSYSSSPSLYSASILSCNTTFGHSPMNRPLFFNNQRRTEEANEESEAPTEDEEESVDTKLHEESVVKDSLFKRDASTNSQSEETNEDNQEMEDDTEEAENQHEEEEDLQEESATTNQPQEDEVSADENGTGLIESELEEDECDQDDDTFQSFSNSTEEEAHESSSNFSHRLGESIQNEASFSLTRHSTQRQNFVSDYSLTKNLARDRSPRKDESYQSGNYSLTRPIFLDSRGILRCSEHVDITDDESNDPEIIARPQLHPVKEDENQEVEQEQEQDEETEEKNQDDDAELTLNLSPSEGSDEERLKKLKEENLSEKQRRSCLSSELSDEALSLFAKKEPSTPRKESSNKKEPSVGRRSRLSSTSSTKSENNSEEGTPLRRSARHQSSLTVKVPTPRRSIKSVSSSSSTKLEEQKDRSKRSSSVTKEVKKILSKVIGEQSIPKINIEEVSPDEEKSSFSRSEVSSPILKKSESKPIRKARPSPRPPLRESPEEKTTPEKEPMKSRATRGGSIIKETLKPTRKTRTASVADGISSTLEETDDQQAERKTGKTRVTRASTATQELSLVKDLTENYDQEENHETEKVAKSRSTRASSQAKETTIKATGRRTRTASTAKEDAYEDKSTFISQRTRSTSMANEDKDLPEEKFSGIDRRMRAVSLAKEEEGASTRIGRRTSAASVTRDEDAPTAIGRRTRAASVTQDEDASTPIGRRTRAASVTQDEDASTPIGRRTRAASVTQDPDASTAIGRRTRAASVTLSEEAPITVGRRTRAASVTKDEDISVPGTMRKTRGTSLAKETTEEEATSSTRTTRGNSVSKETNEEVQEDRKVTRKRGNSVPKELSSAPELSRIVPSRSRRSTSLLKEVILEESLSQIDSPAGGKRSRSTRSTTEEVMVSSPAANTRSRRSSVQSMSDEPEEVPSTRSIRKNNESNVDESRSRRAASVDSSAETAPAGKRMTRSVLAKTTIIDEIIPEEAAVTKSPAPKKMPSRRKRATSVPVDQTAESEMPETNKEKIKPAAATKSKRGRKVSENKDFLFSLPEEAGQEDIDGKGNSNRSPIYKFSKPTMLQKFISPVHDDEESSDKTAKALRRIRVEERVTSAGGLRHPRTCFVLTERQKIKRTEQ